MLDKEAIADKVHGIIPFTQTQWLVNCIRFNTQKRDQATNDFEKDFYKILYKTFYAKTTKNVRKKMNVKIKKKR